MNPVETFQEKIRKPKYWHILALFGAKNWPRNLAHGAHFSRIPESTHNVLVNQDSWSPQKCFEKIAKAAKIPIFACFCNWRSIELEAKIKIIPPRQADGRTDGRTTDDGRPWSRLNPTSKAACVYSKQGPTSCHKIMVSSIFHQIQNNF